MYTSIKRIVPSLVGTGAGAGDCESSMAAAAGREMVKRRANRRTIAANKAAFLAITSILL